MVSLLFLASVVARQEVGPIEASFDVATGIYQVTDRATGWSFLGQAVGTLTDKGEAVGHDSVGPYHDISFAFEDAASPARATIRSYDDARVVKFRLEYRKAIPGNGILFPDFRALPAHESVFSYRDVNFAPGTFSAVQTATPWLMFDNSGRSAILSPASEFMVSRLAGDGKTTAGEGFDPRLKSIPAGFAQESVLVVGDRIGDAWKTWGGAMRRMYNRNAPKMENDPLLKSFGYWTDNGADYYYNYEPDKGYAGTLFDVRDQYRREGIPLGYMQLDSWWYSKTTDDPEGKPGGATKNAKLPAGAWNRYGGLYEYRANADLFPSGLPAFQKRLGLPIAVHNRWMDRNSPYHGTYKISGIAVTDPKWWLDTSNYLSSSDVTCYEQDWLDPIYAQSPAMAEEAGVGDAFTDGMAHAMQRHAITLQYCMATPRFFLQGLKYPNLATIRTSGDRFEPRKWSEFLLGSQLAQSTGTWPWCDVFKSGETGNMILAVLSGGPVGTGDALGRESKEGILKAARPDGVLVKPDASLVPCDQTYQDLAAKRDAPFWASTYTEEDGARTTYLFAFRRSGDGAGTPWTVRLRDVGAKGDNYIFDVLGGTGRRVHMDDPVEVTPSGHENGYDFALLVACPYYPSGIALIGDLGKWASTGAQRIDAVVHRRDGLHVHVLFAPDERAVTLGGVSEVRPTVRLLGGGSAALRSYDPETRRWTVEVSPSAKARAAEVIVKGK